MSRKSLQRVAAAGASAALIATGMTAALGSGVAGAAEPATCGTANTVTEYGSPGLVGLSLSKSVDKAEVAPGGTVTYTIQVSSAKGVPPVLSTIRDYYPDGLKFVGAKVNGKTVDPVVDSNLNMVTQSGKWLIQSKPTLEATYKVSEDLHPGTVLDSGAAMYPDMWGWQQWNPMGVCVTVREKNPVEQAQGSLEGLGLGSVNSGSGQVFGSVTDPQGSISNILSDVLGNVFGS
ncbi:MAG: DUF11 domain-containing protein [Tomitella sp.]|nr:DUF11 domain-containing protein [Tomitella sp.]